MKLGRSPRRVSPYRVNWLTHSAAAADVEQGAVHAALARSSNTRSRATLSASRSACASPSACPTPSSTTSPVPIAPTTSPSTDTEAELTRWIRALTLPAADGSTYAAFNRSR